VDSKDFQLLVNLYDDARRSYSFLGKRVSLSAPAVRDRLIRLKRHGILKGFMLVIDSSIFDRDDVLLFFDGEFSRKSVHAAFEVPDISWVAWKVDGRLHLRLWTKDEREVTDNLISILGVRPSTRAFRSRKKLKKPLSVIDLLIMDSLVDDPKVPFRDILISTGLSAKTVRKHLNNLLWKKSMSIDPILGAPTNSGELIYPIAVAGRVSMEQIVGIMGESAQIHYTIDPPMKHVLCRADSLTDVLTKTRLLEKIKGIKSVTITLDREVLISTNIRHSLIRDEIIKSR